MKIIEILIKQNNHLNKKTQIQSIWNTSQTIVYKIRILKLYLNYVAPQIKVNLQMKLERVQLRNKTYLKWETKLFKELDSNLKMNLSLNIILVKAMFQSNHILQHLGILIYKESVEVLWSNRRTRSLHIKLHRLIWV